MRKLAAPIVSVVKTRWPGSVLGKECNLFGQCFDGAFDAGHRTIEHHRSVNRRIVDR